MSSRGILIAMTTSDFAYILARPTPAMPSFQGADLACYLEHYAGFATEPHVHEDVQLLVPLAGRMHLRAEGRDHLMGPEWACLVMPGTEHWFTCLQGEQTFLALFMPHATVATLNTALELPELPASGAVVTHHLGLYLQGQQLASELRTPLAGQARVLGASVELLLVHLLRARATPAAPPRAASPPRVLRAVETILRRYGERLTIPGLAAELAMSPRHFERCFKEAVGVSPRQFLIQVRIAAAEELLRDPTRPITEIAMTTGFASAAHFGATFRRVRGVTPSEFKARVSIPPGG